MNNDLKQKILAYDRQVPRYTSYPTAPHFSGEVTKHTHKKWLQELPENASISLYIHIPFCKKMCWFCGCNTRIVERYTPVENYLDILFKEIESVHSLIPESCTVSHLHFGGGSPTMLEADDFSKLMNHVHGNFTFNDDAELAIEVDPRGLSEDKIKAYAESGLNRASFGVQDFDAKVQKAINREQSYDLVRESTDLFRKHGIERINFDLMYGLPHQTLDNMRNAVELSLQLKPDRIALFGYAHVPWMKKHMRLIPDDTLPGKSERYDLFQIASKTLEQNDFTPVGIDHFVKSDDTMAEALRSKNLHRNFQGYTIDESDALIGMGISSISSFPQGYLQNVTHNKEYGSAIAAGELATQRGIIIDDEDRLRRAIIEQLMCYMEVDIALIARKYGYSESHFDGELEELKPLQEDGLISITNRKIITSPDARQVVRIVSAVFDTYLDSGTAKHSKAV